MKFDVFFSICQTDVDGYMPDERTMWRHFFDQLQLADELGYGVAWVAETHLSTETQKSNASPVIPHFRGEIGLNTDILQLAHVVFSKTKNIEVGSAIRNILCNGGPLAHSEAVKTFLSLHSLRQHEKRRLHVGFASGRFEFSNTPYGIRPRNNLEKTAWPVVKGKILTEATEIFLRTLRGDEISSSDIPAPTLTRADFRNEEDWRSALSVFEKDGGKANADGTLPLAHRWDFEKVGVIPKEAPLEFLQLVLGSHDSKLQVMANQWLPVAVFNLSITPPEVIEETHRRMQTAYHKSGGPWTRAHMPRTAMVFVDDTPGFSSEAKTEAARSVARKAWENYWRAMEGTLDPKKIEQAVGNTLAGSPEELARLIREKYHPDDRLMLWFDFNNHDNEAVKKSMAVFREKVMPLLS